MKRMENRSIEGDRPVIENPSTPRDFLSNTVHPKLRMNLRRPRRKPKYSSASDSEPVPRGKGEKNRCERSELVPEVMCLQGAQDRGSPRAQRDWSNRQKHEAWTRHGSL